MLNINSKTFVVHVAIWEQKEMPVYSKRQVQVGALLFNEASTKVPVEYSDYSNVFSNENAAKFLVNTKINEHTIKLEEDKQSLFGLI